MGARADRVAIADEELKLLEPRLQRLVIEVPPAADLPELQVSVDGTEWRRAAWGIATVLDPGKHSVRATAPGRRTSACRSSSRSAGWIAEASA